MTVFQNRPGFPSPGLNSEELGLQRLSEEDQASARYEAQLKVVEAMLSQDLYRKLVNYLDSSFDETLLTGQLSELMKDPQGPLGSELDSLLKDWVNLKIVTTRFTIGIACRELAERSLGLWENPRPNEFEDHSEDADS